MGSEQTDDLENGSEGIDDLEKGSEGIDRRLSLPAIFSLQDAEMGFSPDQIQNGTSNEVDHRILYTDRRLSLPAILEFEDEDEEMEEEDAFSLETLSRSASMPNLHQTKRSGNKPKTKINIRHKIVERLQAEKEHIRDNELIDSDLFMCVQVLLEESFEGHQGNDLFDPNRVHHRIFRVRKKVILQELLEQISVTLKYPIHQIRPWAVTYRTNLTCRPTLIDLDNDSQKPVLDVAENRNPWNLFVELIPPDSGVQCLPAFNKESDVLLFFKLYDAKNKRIHYCGHHYMPVAANFQELIPLLNERAGFPIETDLVLYEEIKPNMVERIEKYNEPIVNILEELMDGDIIVFQKNEKDASYEFPTCSDYFKDLYYRVEVTFCDKMIPNDPGFTIDLPHTMTYEKMANAVAQRVGTDAYFLQFFKSQNYKDSPGDPVACTFEGTLKELLVYSGSKSPKKIFYQQLSIRINELENKKQFKPVQHQGHEDLQLSPEM